jgi:GH18 family chitinase
VNDNGFGGILVWEISQDDFHGKCCAVKNALLRAINFGILNKGANPHTYGCEN